MSLLGTLASWRGRRVLITDTHGYPVRTVDVRWTINGVAGSRDEVSQNKRNVPVSELEPLESDAIKCSN
jgi:hypothetical protein